MAIQPIYLSEEDRKVVETFAKNGSHNAHLIQRAKLLLVLDQSSKRSPMRISRTAERHGVSRQTVYNIIEDYHNARDITDFLTRKKRETPPVPAKVDGEKEAHVIALACSEAPDGKAAWSVRLLAEKCVELGIFESISHMTIQRILKKHNISLT